MKKYPEEFKQEIINFYLQNPKVGNHEIICKYNVSPEFIRKCFKEKKIIRKIREDFASPFSYKNEKKMIEEYLKGKSLSSLINKYRTSYRKIKSVFLKNKIKIRNVKDSMIFHKNVSEKYKINENFFENPEKWTEKQAWVLGWFASDGNNYSPKYSFFIKIQERDRLVLDTIKELLNYEGPLIYYLSKNKNHSSTYMLQIRNKKLSSDLYKYGIIDNKSLKLKYPTWLRKDLHRHYIRGYFEGDGCISKIFPKGKCICWSQIGTKWFLKEHKKTIYKQLKILGTKIRLKNKKNNITCYYTFTDKRKLYKLYKYLYSGCNYFLSRKKEKFDIFVKYLQSTNNYSDISPKIINIKNAI